MLHWTSKVRTYKTSVSVSSFTKKSGPNHTTQLYPNWALRSRPALVLRENIGHSRTYLSTCFLCRETRLQQIWRTRFQVLSLGCCSGKSILFSSTTTSRRSTKSLNHCPRVASKADGMCDFNCQDSKGMISNQEQKWPASKGDDCWLMYANTEHYIKAKVSRLLFVEANPSTCTICHKRDLKMSLGWRHLQQDAWPCTRRAEYCRAAHSLSPSMRQPGQIDRSTSESWLMVAFYKWKTLNSKLIISSNLKRWRKLSW